MTTQLLRSVIRKGSAAMILAGLLVFGAVGKSAAQNRNNQGQPTKPPVNNASHGPAGGGAASHGPIGGGAASHGPTGGGSDALGLRRGDLGGRRGALGAEVDREGDDQVGDPDGQLHL